MMSTLTDKYTEPDADRVSALRVVPTRDGYGSIFSDLDPLSIS